MVGYPASASGTLVSGGSMANLIGLTVARNAMSGIDLREMGLAALTAPMRFYGSDQIHSCHQVAVEAMGLGNRALRRVTSDAACRMDLSALRDAIAEDRAAGVQPACVIATAGTVNTGAIDDLEAIADLCAAEGLCCTNPVRDSSRESSVVAGFHEQTQTRNLQDPKLARLQ